MELLVKERRPGILTLTLNRPECLNALNVPLINALHEAFESAAKRSDLRAIILTGAGRSFCAGADMKAEAVDSFFGGQSGAMIEDHVAAFEAAKHLAALTTSIRLVPHPVIAAIRGAAVGGGFALALNSDIRIASVSAKFNVQFPKIGLSSCEMGVSSLLPRIVGAGRAFELMLTSRMLGVAEAEQIGLVSQVTEDDELLDGAERIADSIATLNPFGVRQTKQVMWTNLMATDLASALDLECRTQILVASGLKKSSSP